MEGEYIREIDREGARPASFDETDLYIFKMPIVGKVNEEF